MVTNRTLSFICIFIICTQSLYAQARRFKANDEAPNVTILLRQNMETQAVDVLVSSSEAVSDVFLEVNAKKVSIQMNKAYSIASLPDNGTIKVIQMNGSDVFQLAAVNISQIIWSDAGTFAKANGGLGGFDDGVAGGSYLFGEEGAEGSEGGSGFGGSVSGGGGYTGGEFDPDRKGSGGRTGGGFDPGSGGESSGGGDCPAVQDSLNSLLRAVNGLVKLNQNLAAENKMLAAKVDRIEMSVMDTTQKKEDPKDSQGSTAKDGIGFSIMPNLSYGKQEGDYINPDFGGRFEGRTTVASTGLNIGISFNLSPKTRGHIFAGGGLTIIQQQGVGDPWAEIKPMASLGFGVDLSENIFVGGINSYTFQGGFTTDTRALMGYRRNNAVFGASVGLQLSDGGGLYYRILDTVSLGTFVIIEFGGK